MRPIKFRSWNKETKKMIDLKSITPLALDIDPSIVGARTGIYVPDDDRLIIEQFTGLKDKNGTDIYEGDIVKHHPEPDSYGGWWDGIVTWQPEGSMGWCVEPLPENKHKGRYGMNYSYTFEVLGNIHQPELIKDKDND